MRALPTKPMSAVEAAPIKSFCNRLALEKGLHPAGHADSFEDAVLMETPLPWTKTVYQVAGALPAGAIALLARWMDAYRQTGQYPHRLLMIAPDAAYTRAGYRRVMFYQRPADEAFARFEQAEYHLPEGAVDGLLAAWSADRAQLPAYQQYRVHHAVPMRDVLVCTHGTVDAACAKFGIPLYQTLRQQHAGEHLRVWRVSHFGGHVFAPTLMDMPTGHYWAYVEAAQAAQIAAYDGPVSGLHAHYRGWAGLPAGFVQAAEGALWQRHGWAWLDAPKSGELLAQDSAEHPCWAEVAVRAVLDGQALAYQVRVEVAQHIETPHSSADSSPYPYAQYRVVGITPLA